MKVTSEWLIEQSKNETKQIAYLNRNRMQKNLQSDILTLFKDMQALQKDLKVVSVLHPTYQQFKRAQLSCQELIKRLKNYQKKFYPGYRKVQLLCDENDTLLALTAKALKIKQPDELKKCQLSLMLNRQHLLTMLMYQNLLLKQLKNICQSLANMTNHLRQAQIKELRELAIKNAQLDALWQA